jgi:hypothetical protein
MIREWSAGNMISSALNIQQQLKENGCIVRAAIFICSSTLTFIAVANPEQGVGAIFRSIVASRSSE